MARKRKAKTSAVPTLTRSIVRVTVTADIIVGTQGDYEELQALVNDGTFETTFYDNVSQIIEATNTKSTLKTSIVKLPNPVDNALVEMGLAS